MAVEEATQYADAVVIGEAEEIWQTVITDFEAGRLKKRYHGARVNFEHDTLRPRRELLHPSYIWQSVQTSRGCPFNCKFCSVTKYLGSEYRSRAPEDVLAELETIDSPYIAFVDDNLIGNSHQDITRAKVLFRGMIRRKLHKKWWMQTAINAVDDDEVIRLAAQAGCMFVFVGFETIEEASLKSMRKGVNLRKGVHQYKNVVHAFHRHGIGVMGAFIIGNDFESSGYYKKLAKFLLHSGIDIFQLSLLTPLPGTRLMEEMVNSNSILYSDYPADWEKYRLSYLVHQPQGIDPKDVYWGHNYIKKCLYQFPHYPIRMIKSFFNLKNVNNFIVTLKFNQALKKSWKNAHYYQSVSTLNHQSSNTAGYNRAKIKENGSQDS